jgi:hypothetical protein
VFLRLMLGGSKKCRYTGFQDYPSPLGIGDCASGASRSLQMVTAPRSPRLAPEGHRPYPESPTRGGSSCIPHTKKALSEDDDLASEKC